MTQEDKIVKWILFFQSYKLDYQDLSEEEALFLCCHFLERMELLIGKLNEIGAFLCEVTEDEKGVYTSSLKMSVHAPGLSYGLDTNGAPKAYRVKKFEFLPNNLSEKELAFVQSWFKYGSKDSVNWMNLMEHVLSSEFGFQVRIKGDYPKSVVIYLEN